VKYVIEDYLRGTSNSFDPKKHYGLANYLMRHVWPAIGDVVVKGREAMDWLTFSAKFIVKKGQAEDGDITWLTPSGFLASQAYYEVDEHVVHTKLFGHKRIKVLSELDAPHPGRHGNGMAPNFVHSMDASHLHRTTARLATEIPGVCLAMIHDDFGCHAADTPTLYWVLRDEFVLMYEENDPLQQLQAKYSLSEPPLRGSLALSCVRESEYVFS
jgi:DNA-directed RNA polymerase